MARSFATGWWLPVSGRVAECIAFPGWCRAELASADRLGWQPADLKRADCRGTCEHCRDRGTRGWQIVGRLGSPRPTKQGTKVETHDSAERSRARNRETSYGQPCL